MLLFTLSNISGTQENYNMAFHYCYLTSFRSSIRVVVSSRSIALTLSLSLGVCLCVCCCYCCSLFFVYFFSYCCNSLLVGWLVSWLLCTYSSSTVRTHLTHAKMHTEYMGLYTSVNGEREV